MAVRLKLLLLASLILPACNDNPAAPEFNEATISEVEVLRRLSPATWSAAIAAAPNGTLFLSVIDTVSRSLPSSPHRFDVAFTMESECASTFPCFLHFGKLFAAAPDTLYAVNGSSQIWHWDGAALRRLPTPLSDSTYWCYDFITSASISDIGRFGSELIAVHRMGMSSRERTNGSWTTVGATRV